MKRSVTCLQRLGPLNFRKSVVARLLRVMQDIPGLLKTHKLYISSPMDTQARTDDCEAIPGMPRS